MTPPKQPSRRTGVSSSYDAAEGVPQPPITAPTGAAHGGDFQQFVWIQLADIQKTLGSVSERLDAQKASIDSLKGKVDDLVGWKNKIIGGVAVLLAVGGLIGWAVGKASNFIELKGLPKGASTEQVSAPVQPLAPPAAPIKEPLQQKNQRKIQ